MSGKGNKQRPTDHKKWSNNYDQIKWTKEEDEEFERIAGTSDSVPKQSTPSSDLAG